jgi:trehalose 6-phosphate synthase
LSDPTTPRRKLLVVSNRAPVSYVREAGGGRSAKRGGGGVVTALGGLLAHHDVTWVASAMGEEDRAVAAELGGGGSFLEETADGAPFRLRLVPHGAAAYDRFYNVFANPTLWFLHHYLWDLRSAPDFDPDLYEAWSDGYVPVNEAFAAATLEELEREPDAAVLFQDYHLYLAPGLVREARPELVTSHFVHIPWPEPDYWYALPEELRVAVHEGLLSNDVVGFHTERWRRAFLLATQRLVGADVDFETGRVEYRGRETRVVARPIGVDPAEFDRLANDAAVLEREAALAAGRSERLVVRVDRVDPSKNIVRGFRAFGLLLERHPELHGRVTLAAFLAPSREDIPEYAGYAAAVERAAREVNDRFGRAGWQPVDLDIEDDFPRSVAGYKQFDVLLVNPVFDGLNLVAKEAFLCNECDGVLVLSENAGVHEEIGEWALTVNPLDVSGQADALYAALTLAPEERLRLAEAIRQHVRAHGVEEWIEAQLDDLDAVRSS